jgi:hypothetical protein
MDGQERSCLEVLTVMTSTAHNDEPTFPLDAAVVAIFDPSSTASMAKSLAHGEA